MCTRFFALAGNFLIFFLAAATAQAFQLSGEHDNYVVIGAFTHEKNAAVCTKEANSKSLAAKYELNRSRNLFYVYVMNIDDHDVAAEEARRLREQTKYFDAWVYRGSFSSETSVSGIDLHPETGDKIETINPKDQQQTSKLSANTTNAAERQVVASATLEPKQSATDNVEQTISVLPANATDSTQFSPAEVTEVEKVTERIKDVLVEGDAVGKNFYFKIYRAVDGKEVLGDVNVVDVEKARKVGSYKGNTPVRVKNPGTKSGEVALDCMAFGYRKLMKTINYNVPDGEQIDVDNQQYVIIPFDLVRLQKGDIAVMYNVYFFKDAGVMRPESRYEVNSLAEMLNENPNYKIRIHGHTNGGAAGKIISMGDEKNFFSLTGTKNGYGSAKQLSFERAKVIEEYLIANGINADRMEIKAWGGKRPIHDKHHARAAENVRVEIEILED